MTNNAIARQPGAVRLGLGILFYHDLTVLRSLSRIAIAAVMRADGVCVLSESRRNDLTVHGPVSQFGYASTGCGARYKHLGAPQRNGLIPYPLASIVAPLHAPFSVYTMEGMSQSLAVAIGPLLLLLCFALILYGVFLAQVYFYWNTYHNDVMLTRVFVVLVCIAETVHTATSIHSMFTYFVTDYTDPSGFTVIIWSATTTILLALSIVIAIQGYYICRIWKLSQGSRAVTAILVFLVALKCALSSAACAYMFKYSNWTEFTSYTAASAITRAALGLGFVTDIAITAAFTYYLQRSRASNGRTTRAVNKLLQFTLHSGALTAVVTFAVFIVYVTATKSLALLGLIAILSKVYANAMLAMLNTRRGLREKLTAEDTGSINSVRIPTENVGARPYISPRTPLGLIETRVEIFKETVVMTDEEFGATVRESRCGRRSVSDDGVLEVDKRPPFSQWSRASTG